MLLGVGLVLALAVCPFLGFRLYARRVRRADAPVEDRLHRLERAQQIGGFTLPVVAILLVIRIDLIDRTVGTLEAVLPGLFEIPGFELALVLFVAFGVVTLPIVSAVLGAYPTIRSLRDTSASSLRVVKATLAVMAITAVSVGIAIGGFLAITSFVGSSLPVLVAGVGVILFAVFGLTPYLMALFQDRVPLSGERRERVERLCTELGYTPRGLFLLEGGSTKTANALVAGTVPGFRYVFLTDYLLEECDDDELRAILAHEFGHVAGRHLWQRSLLTVAAVAVWIVGFDVLGLGALEERFGFAGFFLPFMAGYAVYHVALLGGLAYWQEYRADAYAARYVGPEATVDALEVLASANDMTREAGLLYSLATHHPPIADRIEAVRRIDEDETEEEEESDRDSRSATGG